MTTEAVVHAPNPPSGARMLIVALLVPIALIAVIFWLQAEYSRGEQLRLNVRASYDRRIEVAELLSDMRFAESSQRAYVITGDREFRERYFAVRKQVDSDLARLGDLFADSPEQLQRLTRLKAISAAKFAEMAQVVQLNDRVDPAAAQAHIRQGEGKRLMADFQRMATQVAAAEDKVRANRVIVFTARTAYIQRAMWAIVAVATLVLIFALITLWRLRQSQFRTELRAFEAAERNETILDSTVDAILILNPSGTIETINRAAIRMLGYRPEELSRRDIGVLTDIAPGTGSFHQRVGLVDGTLRSSFLTDRKIRHRDGQYLSVEIALGVMSLPDGDHIVASVRDISERKRVEQLKDEFISMVSHELRTPLTSIVGALGLLGADAGGALSPQAARLVEIAGNNSRRLIRLINDMLDVDRMDSGKLRLSMRLTDLRDVILRACDGNEGLAKAYRAEIRCDIPETALTVSGDEERLIQVITNLTSNALKVTPNGGLVTIGVERSDDGRRFIVHVDDTGPGVPEEFRSRIFGRFERAATDEGSAGTGLGLAIAREIVTRHGGEIWFADRAEGGSRFAFSIPAARTVQLAGDIDGDAKILILDSDVAVARALKTFLTYEGYEARVVQTAAAARSALEQNGFGVLLLDMALKEDDAFALARELRQHDGPDKLSILMMTATDGERLDASVQLDLVDWIEKPIDPHRLKSAIRTAIRQGGIERPTVLHLDDDEDTLDVTATALEGEVTMLKATTLQEARELLRLSPPHLAIIDVNLKEGSGLDLLPELSDREGAAIPTIVYSAHDVATDIAGSVDAVLTKSSSSLPDLKATIRRVVAARHQGEQE